MDKRNTRVIGTRLTICHKLFFEHPFPAAGIEQGAGGKKEWARVMAQWAKMGQEGWSKWQGKAV